MPACGNSMAGSGASTAERASPDERRQDRGERGALWRGLRRSRQRARCRTAVGLFGERDNNTRNDLCQTLAARSSGLMQVHVYENDFHAFDAGVSGPVPNRPFSPPCVRVIIMYDPVAARDSRARGLAFFGEKLK
jgi:dienelactone hydrolase